jgi:uncharacterized membrane protein HdeD (DUF308 family)
MAANPISFELHSLRSHWGWLLALGVVMVVLGTIALMIIPAATIGTALVLGWLLVASGVFEMVHAFRVRQWGGFFLHLIGAVLGLLSGLLVVTHPLAGAAAATLLFASFLTAIGLFRLIAALSLKFPHWGWAVFDSLVTLGLGILLWAEWPSSGVWILGVCVGVSLLLRGWSYVMFAIAIRKLPAPLELRQAA